MKAKVASFTLQEMSIVMVVSVILIGIAFTVLSLVQRNIGMIQKNLNNNTELNMLEQSLWIDMNKYRHVSFFEREDKLVFRSPVDSTVYFFKNEIITKEKDTFNIEIEDKRFYFNGNPTANMKIDAIKLKFAKHFGNRQMFIFKKNDATQFMN